MQEMKVSKLKQQSFMLHINKRASGLMDSFREKAIKCSYRDIATLIWAQVIIFLASGYFFYLQHFFLLKEKDFSNCVCQISAILLE